ncbi:putative SGNH hydrolase-type esterase domain-containing protein [Medicago truncatula]|nr:putative SGNH hydrolase-type esterase domain-containing protein [Medicago truncatula]
MFRGYRGYNTRWALKVLEKVFPVSHGSDRGTETAPIALTIFFGANDACLPNRCYVFQHVPLHEYKDNLRSIVSFFKISINEELTRPSFKIRVNNPEGLPEWTNEAAGEYAKACILWPMSVKFLSLISGLKCNGSLDGKNDGLHLTNGGNQFVFEEVIKKLRDEGVSLESMAVDLPLLADIDPNDSLIEGISVVTRSSRSTQGVYVSLLGNYCIGYHYY